MSNPYDYLDLTSLPEDIILNQIIPNIPINRLKELCSSNSYFARLCQNENIWRSRIYLEYPEAGIKPVDVTWLEFYLDTKKWFDVTINKFPEIDEKPDNLLWSQYYRRLLYATGFEKNIIIRGNAQPQLGRVKIIPTVTTIKSLFIKIENILKQENEVELIRIKPLPPSNVLNTMTSGQLLNLSASAASDIILFKLGSRYYANQLYDPIVKALVDPNFGIVSETVGKPTQTNFVTLLTILIAAFKLPSSLLYQLPTAAAFWYTSYQSGVGSYFGSYITRYILKYLRGYELKPEQINQSLI